MLSGSRIPPSTWVNVYEPACRGQVGVGVRVGAGVRVGVGDRVPVSQGKVETCVYCLKSRRRLSHEGDDCPTQVRQKDSHSVSAGPENPLQTRLGETGDCGRLKKSRSNSVWRP
jgi:hypothetical protein